MMNIEKLIPKSFQTEKNDVVYPLVKIIDVTEISKKKVKKFEGYKFYLTTGNLDNSKILVLNKVTHRNRPSRADLLVDIDNVIFAKMQSTKKILLIDDKIRKLIVSTGYYVLIPKQDKILPKYLFFIVESNFFQNQKDKFCVGATQKALNNEGLKNLKIPLPYLHIQQKIVKRLDAIRETQELNEKQISNTNELFQSLLYRELKPKKGWKVKKLAKVADILMGQSPPGDTYNVNRDGLPFLQGKAEFGEIYPTIVRFCSAPTRIAHFNDILLSIRAPVGPVNLSPMDVCIGRGLSAIRGNADVLNQRFLFFFMKLNEIILAESAVGSTFSSVCKRDIENIKIYFPSLKIQRQIVKKLTIVLEYKKKLLKQKELLQELFESTLNKTMKGELIK